MDMRMSKPEADAEGASTERKAAARDPEALTGNARLVLGEYLPWPEQPFEAVSETELSARGQRFPPRCSVAFGDFVAFHIFCCFALLKKSSIKWKKNTFSESRGCFWQFIQYAMQDGPTIFLFQKKKRFPWASLNSQFQTDWQPGVDKCSRSHSITIQLQVFKTQLILFLTFPSSCKVPLGTAFYFDFEFLLGRLTGNGFGLNSCTEHILFCFVAISNDNT